MEPDSLHQTVQEGFIVIRHLDAHAKMSRSIILSHKCQIYDIDTHIVDNLCDSWEETRNIMK